MRKIIILALVALTGPAAQGQQACPPNATCLSGTLTAEDRELALIGCHDNVLMSARINFIQAPDPGRQTDPAGYQEVGRRAWAAFLDGDLDRCLDLRRRLDRWTSKGLFIGQPPEPRDDEVKFLVEDARRLREGERARSCERSYAVNPGGQKHREDLGCDALPEAGEVKRRGEAQNKKFEETMKLGKELLAKLKRDRDDPRCAEPGEASCLRWKNR